MGYICPQMVPINKYIKTETKPWNIQLQWKYSCIISIFLLQKGIKNWYVYKAISLKTVKNRKKKGGKPGCYVDCFGVEDRWTDEKAELILSQWNSSFIITISLLHAKSFLHQGTMHTRHLLLKSPAPSLTHSLPEPPVHLTQKLSEAPMCELTRELCTRCVSGQVGVLEGSHLGGKRKKIQLKIILGLLETTNLPPSSQLSWRKKRARTRRTHSPHRQYPTSAPQEDMGDKNAGKKLPRASLWIIY